VSSLSHGQNTWSMEWRSCCSSVHCLVALPWVRLIKSSTKTLMYASGGQCICVALVVGWVGHLVYHNFGMVMGGLGVAGGAVKAMLSRQCVVIWVQ